jgi:hypothetical protein
MVGAYLRAQNRPLSAIMVHDNLHGRVNKALLETALATLVERGDVCRKEYGKAAIFWFNQMAFSDVTAADVGAAVAACAELEARAGAASARRKATEKHLATLTSGPAGPALEAALSAAREQAAALEARLKGIADAVAAAAAGSAGAPRILSASEKAALRASIDRYKGVWRTRKAAAAEVAGGIADAGGPSIKAFFAACGVETDEDAKVNIKDI